MALHPNERLPNMRPAVTDLYDEKQHTFLVQYPPGLVVALGLSGVLAFVLAGFQGYASLKPTVNGSAGYPNFLEWLFHEPWLLFFWLCALLLVFQAAIFRDATMRRQRRQMLAMTGIAMVLVIVGYYLRNQFEGISSNGVNIFQALNIHIVFPQNTVLAVINYGILGIFWADSLRRWVRCARGGACTPQVMIRRGSQRSVPVVTPSLAEVMAGDLIAGGALAAILWGVFQPQVMGRIISFINTRDLAAPPAISAATCATNCPLVDRNQMFLYLSLGLLVLALTALTHGLAALNAVDRPVLPHPIEEVGDETGTEKGTEGVVETVIDTLLTAVSRQGAQTATGAWLALRTLLWPFLVLAAVVGLAVSAHFTQLYLHGLSCLHGTNPALACDPYSLVHHDWVSLTADVLFALVGLLVAGLGAALAAGLLVFQRHVTENTLRFMELIGLVGLLTLWIFALALAGFNVLLAQVTGVTARWPFAQPEPLTIISFVALVVYATLLAGHRVRRGDAPFPLPIIRVAPPPALPPPAAGAEPAPARPLGYERVTLPEAS